MDAPRLCCRVSDPGDLFSSLPDSKGGDQSQADREEWSALRNRQQKDDEILSGVTLVLPGSTSDEAFLGQMV